MPIQKIIPKSIKSLRPTNRVTDFNNIYIRQAIQDMLDTLEEKQRMLDLDFPNAGGGVGLASNQIEYPYEPVSDVDDTPKPGFYPKDFMPPNIYVVSIRKARALRESCEVVKPSVYINASFEPFLSSSEEGRSKQSFYEEGCLSVEGFKGFGIPRYENILITAFNQSGEEIISSVDGFIARVHQHEIDHGLGNEYLNQLQFSSNELTSILVWVYQHRGRTPLKASEWVIQDKLKCVDENPDFTALEAWANYELSKKNKKPPLLNTYLRFIGNHVANPPHHKSNAFVNPDGERPERGSGLTS